MTWKSIAGGVLVGVLAMFAYDWVRKWLEAQAASAGGEEFVDGDWFQNLLRPELFTPESASLGIAVRDGGSSSSGGGCGCS